MEAFYSDSGEHLTVVLTDGASEQFTVEEFISIYGMDALPPQDESEYKGLPFSAEEEELSSEEMPLPVLEYLGEFKALIDACGQVSYFFNMRKYINAGVNKAKAVASAYEHDVRYYTEQCNEWRVKAERSFAVLTMHAAKFGYKMPQAKDFLNVLTLSPDRRKAYKGYLNTCVKNNKALSPADLEKKYQNLLRKRLKKA